MAAIQAGRAARAEPGAPPLRIVALDGAGKIGAKILIAGGGRCNVTHFEVSADDFAGSSRHAIAKVLRELPVAAVVAFFRELGVELKREKTGKLFPTTDEARTVLEALLGAARDAGVEIRYPRRVTAVERSGEEFVVRGPWGALAARRVFLAAGGQALPKSGSDGAGVALARALGHTSTATIFPALVPLTLPEEHWIRSIPGVATPARVEVRGATGKRLAEFTGDLLCTHFGLSGPVILDASRYLLAARQESPQARLVIAFLPHAHPENLALELANLGRKSLGNWLAEKVPDRLAAALVASAGLDPASTSLRMTREERKRLIGALVEQEVPVSGDRGFTYAEATAGGIPLDQVRLDTMESRRSPGLHLCGELLDVDGRIGGFNFQWAWASGKVAGVAALEALKAP
jgi:predicted Rossmann fold flavoprotein